MSEPEAAVGMDRELRDKWVAALRSGEYKQGLNQLRGKDEDGTDTFCCLGVLCDVVDPNGWHGWDGYWALWSREGDEAPFAVNVPEDILAASAGSRLIDLNDRERLGFKGIADYIEATL